MSRLKCSQGLLFACAHKDFSCLLMQGIVDPSGFAKQCWLESWLPLALGAATSWASCGESQLLQGDKQPKTGWKNCVAFPERDGWPGP